jgi:hypothetical protein
MNTWTEITSRPTAAGIAGLVLAFSAVGDKLAAAPAACLSRQALGLAVHYRGDNIAAAIAISGHSPCGDATASYHQPKPALGRQARELNHDAAQAERQARTQALHALFAWIDAQPAVPYLPLDAMDRDDIY